MKRMAWRSIVLVLVTLLTSSDALFAKSKSLKIAMMQWRGETEGCRGFKDGLKELGYAVEYTELNAGQDRKELGRLIRQELLTNLDNFDYVYSFGTTVSMATKLALNNRVPQLFNIVTAPVESGLVQSLDNPGANINGATHKIPLENQIKAALNVFPFQRLGFLFNPREKNSMILRQQLRDVAQKLDLDVIDLRCPPAYNMLEQTLQKLLDKSIMVDAVYLPLDTHIFTHAPRIGAKLREAKIKSIGSLKRFVQHGALIGVVPNYYGIGKAIAAIVDRHQKGEELQDIPVVRVKAPILMINTTTARLLQVHIPEEMLKEAVIIE